MDDLDKRAKDEYIACTIRGLTYAYVDNFDVAFSYLNEALKARDAMLLSLKYEHWVPEALKKDPRFKELLNKIGFPKVN